jgi:hypothetical protein
MKHSRTFEFAPKGNRNEGQGPELVLAPNQAPMMIQACCSAGGLSEPMPMSDRFSAFGSGTVEKNGHRSSSRQRMRLLTPTAIPQDALGSVTIPIADITAVDLFGGANLHQSNITTTSCGHYELTMENRNGLDMLVAFLKAGLPKDRVKGGSIHHRTGSQLSRNSGSTANGSFDVEAFTAERMAERMENETVSEKLRRKVVRVFSSLEESKFWFDDDRHLSA